MRKTIPIVALFMGATAFASFHMSFETTTLDLMNAVAECNTEFMTAMDGAQMSSATYHTDRPGESYMITTMKDGKTHATLEIIKLRSNAGKTQCRLTM